VGGGESVQAVGRLADAVESAGNDEHLAGIHGTGRALRAARDHSTARGTERAETPRRASLSDAFQDVAAPRRQLLGPPRVLMIDGTDEAELVRRCVAGDAEAFEPLLVRYERPIFNVALRMVGDREDARDLTQNTFVKAFEKLRGYDPQQRFFSWIYRIAINECLNFRARRRPGEPLDPMLPSRGRDPEHAAAAGELEVRIQAALFELPAPQRLVVVLRHFMDLTYAEISAVLLVPEKTVKSRLYSARERLSVILEEPAAHARSSAR
jgi:RNA polymerase sigma-70 factor (ECF subfamily)